MLDAQRIYGAGRPRIGAHGPVEFGIDLRRTVPEDAFDTQPIIIGDTLLIADIRLDNRKDLLRQLGQRTAEADSAADSSILALAWDRWGSGCIDRLCGEFAIAAFDGKTHELTLARDTTGQRPLHYARRETCLAFASMPTGILALPDGWQGFNEESLSRLLLDVPYQPTATCFAGIDRISPGEIVTFNINGQKIRPSWRPNFQELRLADDRAYVEAYREVLDLAVQSHMRRITRPLASHLSSGFDSSAVAATAARLLSPNESLIALTAAPEAGFEGDAPRKRVPDESELAALTAAKHGMRHIVVRRSDPLVDRIRAQVRFCQDPFSNLINSGWLSALDRTAQKNGAGVLLCGDLGNLTLNAGGLRTLADIFRQQGLGAWWREARLSAEQGDARWTGILFNSFGHRLPLTVQDMLIRRFQHIHSKDRLSLINPDFRRAQSAQPLLRLGTRTADSYRQRWELLRTLDFGNLRKASLAETGVETRDPLADLRILKFSTALPREKLLHQGTSRPLSKASLSDRVPTDVLHAKMRGYQASDWSRQIDAKGLRALTEEMSASDTARRMIDLPRLNRLLDAWSGAPDQRFSAYEMFAGHVPQAIAVGLFIREYER